MSVALAVQAGILDRGPDARGDRRQQTDVLGSEPAFLPGALHTDHADRVIAHEDRNAQVRLWRSPDPASPDLLELRVAIQ